MAVKKSLLVFVFGVFLILGLVFTYSVKSEDITNNPPQALNYVNNLDEENNVQRLKRTEDINLFDKEISVQERDEEYLIDVSDVLTPPTENFEEEFAVISSGIECGSIPTDGCVVTQDTIFEPGTYNLPNGISIEADNITLDCNDAKLVGSGTGVYLYKKYKVTIKNCNFRNYKYPLYLTSSNNNIIYNNDVNSSASNSYGIYLYNSSNNIISKNNFSSQGNFYTYGVWLHFSSNNTLSNNNIFNNGDGIFLWTSSNDNSILNNNINSNVGGEGIYVYYSYDNKISNNSILNNYHGIILYYSSNTNIFYNKINLNEGTGVLLGESATRNTIFYNNIQGNYRGIRIYSYSFNNKIYLNNFLDNAENNILFSPGSDILNSLKVIYKHNNKIYSGYLGNYWDDYLGSDVNESGIGDISHNYDNYPLIRSFENYEIIDTEPTDLNLDWIYEADSTINTAAISSENYISFGGRGVGGGAGIYLLDKNKNLLWNHTIKKHYYLDYPIVDISMTNDATKIIAGSSEGHTWGGVVYFFDLEGNLYYNFSVSYGVTSVSFSPEGDYFAMTYGHYAGWWDKVALWGYNEEQWLWDYTFGESESTDVSVSFNGEYVAVGGALEPWSDDIEGVRLYNKAGNLLWEYKIDASWFGSDKYSVAISQNGEYMVAGNKKNNNLYFFDKSGNLLWNYSTGPIQGVAISADGNRIIAGSKNNLYLLNRHKELLRVFQTDDVIKDVAMSPNKKTIVVVAENNMIYLFSWEEEKPNSPPETPTNLKQFKSDTITEIPIGGTVNEKIVLLQANSTDPDGDKVKIQVEIRRIGDVFLNRATHESGFYENTTNELKVLVYGMPNGDYYWQTRVVDEYGLASEWISFGNNSELENDFSVRINYPPVASFTYEPKYPEIGQEISFDASSSYDPNGGLLSYEWNFGDGNYGEGKIVNHIYLTTGSYDVNLTVTDDEGSKSKFSVSIDVFSIELRESIENIVNNTKKLLNHIYGDATNVANAVDYFKERVSEEKTKLIVGSALLVGTSFLPDVKKVSALSTMDYIKLAEKYPTLADIIDDNGWIVMKGVETILKDAFEDMAIDIVERLKSNDFSYNNTFIPDLLTKNRDRKNNLTNFKDEVINNIENLNLTQEEVDLYKKELRKRSLGNSFIRNTYYKKALIPTELRDMKISYDLSWEYIFTEIGMTSVKFALSIWGGPFLVKSLKVVELIKDLNTLTEDEKVLTIGIEVLSDSFVQSDIISRNTFQGLIDINNKTPPNIVGGEIVSIENFMEGYILPRVHYNPYYSFLYENIYSEVKVKNTGDIKAEYELITYVPFSVGVFGYKLPYISNERKEIEPRQTETFIVLYKEQGEGINPKNTVTQFILLGESNGTYGLSVNTTIFGTTKIVLNDVNYTEEELENSIEYPYPINSELEEFQYNNYSLYIYIENPFDFPIQANLTQEIPPTISIENNSENISLQLELEPEERKMINISFKPKEYWTIKIPAANLEIYDRVNDYWLEFLSNNITFCIPKGDVDGNYLVNIFDLAGVGLCYGQPAEGNCESADVTGDGLINIFDLATVGLNYGRNC